MKLGQGNIFTCVCDSVNGGVSGPGGSPISGSSGGLQFFGESPIFLGSPIFWGEGLQFFGGGSPIFFSLIAGSLESAN